MAGSLDCETFFIFSSTCTVICRPKLLQATAVSPTYLAQPSIVSGNGFSLLLSITLRERYAKKTLSCIHFAYHTQFKKLSSLILLFVIWYGYAGFMGQSGNPVKAGADSVLISPILTQFSACFLGFQFSRYLLLTLPIEQNLQ